MSSRCPTPPFAFAEESILSDPFKGGLSIFSVQIPSAPLFPSVTVSAVQAAPQETATRHRDTAFLPGTSPSLLGLVLVVHGIRDDAGGLDFVPFGLLSRFVLATPQQQNLLLFVTCNSK